MRKEREERREKDWRRSFFLFLSIQLEWFKFIYITSTLTFTFYLSKMANYLSTEYVCCNLNL